MTTNTGYHPNGMAAQTPMALQHIIHQTGQASQAGLNHAVQAWAGLHLLAAGNERLTAAPFVHTAETVLSLGGNHLNVT